MDAASIIQLAKQQEFESEHDEVVEKATMEWALDSIIENAQLLKDKWFTSNEIERERVANELNNLTWIVRRMSEVSYGFI